jgi:hypothetical protein
MNIDGRSAQAFHEQAPQLTRTDAHASRKLIDGMILQQSAFNELQRTRDDMIATLPRVIAWCEFGAATQTRAKTGCFGRRGSGEKADVFGLRGGRRANRPTINTGAAHGDKEQTVKARIAAQTRPFARLLVEHGSGGCLGHVLRLAPPSP